jgi:hypothetical protein
VHERKHPSRALFNRTALHLISEDRYRDPLK